MAGRYDSSFVTVTVGITRSKVFFLPNPPYTSILRIHFAIHEGVQTHAQIHLIKRFSQC